MQNILELAIEKAFYDLSLDPFDDQQLEEFLKSLKVPKKKLPKVQEKLTQELAQELLKQLESTIDMLYANGEYKTLYAMFLTACSQEVYK